MFRIMKHIIIISYIFCILLLGSSFCLGLPQNSNESISNEHNQTRLYESTTAEPKLNLSMNHNDSLNTTTSKTTPKKAEKLDTTTQSYHDKTTKTINYSPFVELSTTGNSPHLAFTTTAIPSSSLPSIVASAQRQFDILSFLGGSLFTFCLMGIGVVLWKAYKMQIERNYRTI